MALLLLSLTGLVLVVVGVLGLLEVVGLGAALSVLFIVVGVLAFLFAHTRGGRRSPL